MGACAFDEQERNRERLLVLASPSPIASFSKIANVWFLLSQLIFIFPLCLYFVLLFS